MMLESCSLSIMVMGVGATVMGLGEPSLCVCVMASVVVCLPAIDASVFIFSLDTKKPPMKGAVLDASGNCLGVLACVRG